MHFHPHKKPEEFLETMKEYLALIDRGDGSRTQEFSIPHLFIRVEGDKRFMLRRDYDHPTILLTADRNYMDFFVNNQSFHCQIASGLAKIKGSKIEIQVPDCNGVIITLDINKK